MANWGTPKGGWIPFLRNNKNHPRLTRLYKVDPITSCWWGTTAIHHTGYHVCSFDNKQYRLHKFMYEIYKGDVPFGMVIDHLCRNVRCCNPDHLEVVSSYINTMRGDMAKLTANDIDAIRQEVKAGALHREAAKKYGIDRAHVTNIVNYNRHFN